MRDDLTRLLRITAGCRYDMHEPDEHGLTARVIGFEFDNACGDSIGESQIEGGSQELVVILDRDGHTERFNLATLIALARESTLRL